MENPAGAGLLPSVSAAEYVSTYNVHREHGGEAADDEQCGKIQLPLDWPRTKLPDQEGFRKGAHEHEITRDLKPTGCLRKEVCSRPKKQQPHGGEGFPEKLYVSGNRFRAFAAGPRFAAIAASARRLKRKPLECRAFMPLSTTDSWMTYHDTSERLAAPTQTMEMRG